MTIKITNERSRNLPHIEQDTQMYFITWRLSKSQKPLTHDERSMIQSAIEHFNRKRYEMFAYVVMNDHIHVLVKINDDYRLSSLVHTWKSFTANQLQRSFGRTGNIWQKEYWDTTIYKYKTFKKTMEYIINNPWKRWPELERYPWRGLSPEYGELNDL
jgi:REP element-mobilizing transposase RayT